MTGLFARHASLAAPLDLLRSDAASRKLRVRVDIDGLGLGCAILSSADVASLGRTPRTDSVEAVVAMVEEIAKFAPVAVRVGR